MKKSEFQKLVYNRINSELSECARKYLAGLRLSSEIGAALSKMDENKRISKTLVKYFNQLVDDLKNTSSKNMATPCLLCASDKLKPIDQQWEVYRALINFLQIACTRDVHGIRNAYVSFSRPRKQKIVRSEWNPDGARKGRPNLYNSEEFRYVVNRAAKIKRANSSSH